MTAHDAVAEQPAERVVLRLVWVRVRVRVWVTGRVRVGLRLRFGLGFGLGLGLELGCCASSPGRKGPARGMRGRSAAVETRRPDSRTRAKLAESSCAAGCSTPAASARRSLLAVSRGAALVRVRVGAR